MGSLTLVFMLGSLKFERNVLLEIEDGRTVHGEVAAVGRLPFVVLFGEGYSDEADDRVVVGEDADDVGPRRDTAHPGGLLRLTITVAARQIREHQLPAPPVLPKGTDHAVHTPGHLRAVEDELNRRPRIVLDDRAPADLFNELLASSTGQVLRR